MAFRSVKDLLVSAGLGEEKSVVTNAIFVALFMNNRYCCLNFCCLFYVQV